MAKTVEEFKDDLRALRDEMYQSSDKADLKLIASYLDRLLMSLEELSDTLGIMSVEIETLSEDECSCEGCMMPMAKTAKRSKPAVKKMAKKSKPAKKKRRR